MRLLQSINLELKEFSDKEIPPYAILSHTWGENEVSFQDMQGRSVAEKLGYIKIKGFCDIAAADGFEYVWIDTCCIDKSSSAELSEAINSMFRWYHYADVCYVYLSDVLTTEIEPHFCKSKWFTRGWTLQELLAPTNVIFLNKGWQEIGTKSSLGNIIATITGINKEFLLGKNLDEASVAQKMSWASKRETTRVEDLAYSLMGIFGVNMPMLYGEGERAFIRLQEEIMKLSSDHTLFAWELRGRESLHKGLLASSPAAFYDCGNIVQTEDWGNCAPFTVTSKGISVALRLVPSDISRIYKAVLDCREDGNPKGHIGIWVKRLSDGGRNYEKTWRKPEIVSLDTISHLGKTLVCVKQIWSSHTRDKVGPCYDECSVGTRGLESLNLFPQAEFFLLNRMPSDKYRLDNGVLQGMFGGVRFMDNQGSDFVVVLKKTADRANIHLVTAFSHETVEDVVKSFAANQREWKDESDRILTHLASGDQICVALKRRLVSGKRELLIDLSPVIGKYP